MIAKKLVTVTAFHIMEKQAHVVEKLPYSTYLGLLPRLARCLGNFAILPPLKSLYTAGLFNDRDHLDE